MASHLSTPPSILSTPDRQTITLTRHTHTLPNALGLRRRDRRQVEREVAKIEARAAKQS
jgi:hypothetical protein